MTPKVGDVVLIKEDLSRGKWRISHISKFISSLTISFFYLIDCPEENNAGENQSSSDNQTSSSKEINHDDEIPNHIDDSLEKQDKMKPVHPICKAVVKACQRLQHCLRKFLWGVSWLTVHNDIM